MDDSQRERFLRRISTVGTGTREAVQMLIGGVVCDLRDQVVEGVFGEADMDAVVPFYDDAEELWRLTISTDPPLESQEMIERLRKLRDACSGPLAGFRLRIESALGKAEALEEARKRR